MLLRRWVRWRAGLSCGRKVERDCLLDRRQSLSVPPGCESPAKLPSFPGPVGACRCCRWAGAVISFLRVLGSSPPPSPRASRLGRLFRVPLWPRGEATSLIRQVTSARRTRCLAASRRGRPRPSRPRPVHECWCMVCGVRIIIKQVGALAGRRGGRLIRPRLDVQGEEATRRQGGFGAGADDVVGQGGEIEAAASGGVLISFAA